MTVACLVLAGILVVVLAVLWRQDPEELELGVKLPFGIGLNLKSKGRRRRSTGQGRREPGRPDVSPPPAGTLPASEAPGEAGPRGRDAHPAKNRERE